MKGEVLFTAKDGFFAEFMTACQAEKAILKNVVVSGEGITANVCWRDYVRVIRAAQRSGMVLIVSERSGMPDILNKYKKRIGIPVGVLLFIFILLFLSSTLWSIEITGLKTISENSFRAYLEQANVKQGVFLGTINCNEIESYSERYGEQILRSTVNLVGCRLYVNIDEREVIPEISGRKRYCNIIAGKDGEILKADVFSGASDVRVGDAVLKGDLLVNGIQNTPGGATIFLEAKAMILARTQTGFTCQTGKHIKVQKIEASKNKYAIRMFGVTVPEPSEKIACVSMLSADSVIFPLAVVRTHEKVLKEERITLNDHKSFLIAFTDLAAAAADMMKSIAVVDCRIRVQANTQVSVEAQFVCEEDIAVPQYFETINKY